MNRAHRRQTNRAESSPAPLLFAAGLVAGLLVALVPVLRAQETLTIPLQLVNIGNATTPQYKLGITIGFDNNPPKIYEFDTGAAGFFAASGNHVTWWDGGVPVGNQTITMNYTSGYSYVNSPVVTANLSFYPPGQETTVNPLFSTASANLTVALARIDNVQYKGAPNAAWTDDLAANPPRPPLEGHFFGDFGVALYRNSGVDFPPSNNGIFAILPQLPGNLSSGFIVKTGGYGNPTPLVQLGITAEDRAQYPLVIPLVGNATGANASITFPNSGAATFAAAAINATLTLSRSGLANQTIPGVGLVLDTGAPSTMAHVGSLLQINPGFINNQQSLGLLANGASFSLSAPAGNQTWTFTQTQSNSSLPGLNDVSISGSATNPYAPSAEGYVNTGLSLYFRYNVMFDLQHAVLRLQPIPAAGTPMVVPLYRTAGDEDFRVYAALGNGTTYLPYLLDTGSPQMFAAYGPWWGSQEPPRQAQGSSTFTFAAGFGYFYNPWPTIVRLGNNQGQELASTQSPVNLGLITNVDAGNATISANQTYANWQNLDYLGNQTALPGGTFGNFGAGLYGNGTFATILAQIPVGPGLKRGFIINSGGPGSLQGSLTIGLDAATIAQFQTSGVILRMTPNVVGNATQVLAGGATSYNATQVTGSTLTLNGTTVASLPVIFDTGGGNLTIIYSDQNGAQPIPSSFIQGNATHGPVNNGVRFALQGPGLTPSGGNVTSTFYPFTVNNAPALIALSHLGVDPQFTAGLGYPRINTGIQVFNRYQVMFNLDDGWLGLLPLVAPPTIKVQSRRLLPPGRNRIEVSGIASSSVGLAAVTVERAGAAARPVTGKSRWRFVEPLRRGRNVFVVTATDNLGDITRREVVVVHR